MVAWWGLLSQGVEAFETRAEVSERTVDDWMWCERDQGRRTQCCARGQRICWICGVPHKDSHSPQMWVVAFFQLLDTWGLLCIQGTLKFSRIQMCWLHVLWIGHGFQGSVCVFAFVCVCRCACTLSSLADSALAFTSFFPLAVSVWPLPLVY